MAAEIRQEIAAEVAELKVKTSKVRLFFSRCLPAPVEALQTAHWPSHGLLCMDSASYNTIIAGGGRGRRDHWLSVQHALCWCTGACTFTSQ